MPAPRPSPVSQRRSPAWPEPVSLKTSLPRQKESFAAGSCKQLQVVAGFFRDGGMMVMGQARDSDFVAPSHDGAQTGKWWARQDSNLQGLPHVVLSHARLPFRHSPNPARAPPITKAGRWKPKSTSMSRGGLDLWLEPALYFSAGWPCRFRPSGLLGWTAIQTVGEGFVIPRRRGDFKPAGT